MKSIEFIHHPILHINKKLSKPLRKIYYYIYYPYPQITLSKQFGFRRSCQGGSGTGNHLYSALNRQNGSIRLNTTTMVNNNTPNDLIANTFKIIQYQNKSLQESLRTSSSIHHHHHNHHNHYGGSCRAHRLRCVSVSSQSTLMTSLGKNDVFAPTTYTSVVAATIPAGCSILLDDDLHKQNDSLGNTEAQIPPPSLPPTTSSDIEICENNDAKLTKKTIPEPVHEKLSNKKNNHNNISSGNILDNNNSSNSSRNSLKTLESLSEKLPWKARRKKPTPVFFRNNSNSSNCSSTSSYTCNLNNNLHNSKNTNIIIELSNTSTSSKDVEDDEDDVVVEDAKDIVKVEIGDAVEGASPTV